MKPIIAALAGHPNCGKSTLFNALTGLNQVVGNWSGVTVGVKKGHASIGQFSFQFVDLPGCHNLVAIESNISEDQRISQQYLQLGEASCILNVINANELDKQLSFTLELLEKGLPVIVVLNMMDVAGKKGLSIDTTALSQLLGCTVVPMAAITKKGLSTLKNVMIEALCPIPASQKLSADSVASFNSNPISPFVGCVHVVDTFALPLSSEKRLLKAEEISNKVCQKSSVPKRDWSLFFDKIVLHKVFGLPLLLAFMYSAFGFTIHIGGGLQDFAAKLLQKIFIEMPEAWLHSISAPSWLSCFLTQGLGQGILTTLSFVPVIAAMFFCLSLLEASGYMARAAIVVDKIMRWIGLSGKSFIPMILGFGCNVPAILATRTLECRRERILTILMSPFMSCGARLAIYALFVTAFFKDGGHNVIFALYCIGILMALLTGWVLRNTLLVGDKSTLKMELPPYRLPRFKMIVRTTAYRTWGFVTKAGLIIVPVCVLFGLLGSFKTGEETWLAFLGQYITPIFSPMGIEPDNWPATVGLLSGVVAKEVVVGTLNTLYASSNGIGSLVDYFGGPVAAFSYLIFVLLYFPCVSVLATISRELNLGWATFTAIWTTSIAYGTAVLFYQLATFFEHPEVSLLWIVLILGVSVLVWFSLRFIGRHTMGKKPQKPLPTQILILN